MRLHLICFAPEESVYVKGDQAEHLYIIRRGIVGAHGRVLGTGKPKHFLSLITVLFLFFFILLLSEIYEY